ncbi:23S rRNA (guanosine(2251)-2'-O)-methyltransferase RlmB [Collinsella sp. AGMB00827]|uniref:23S rRNA (Guanosine(2251)-2'-O)-methyltransferase RlmB n=1 Tax=Collinsella ureilytica TaxID=2869515 RepID=A0ABS7MJZ8_9ACTN|nr:23S rRNA (guanosine(2251)-2'-O)-methyltransferase RlmB [Collinsella urealyticum]MBY4797410.1 23S rRNA (guanosine(2251)-2'-O)-methyltransferase RlmB [Collinsella urealyticum]
MAKSKQQGGKSRSGSGARQEQGRRTQTGDRSGRSQSNKRPDRLQRGRSVQDRGRDASRGSINRSQGTQRAQDFGSMPGENRSSHAQAGNRGSRAQQSTRKSQAPDTLYIEGRRAVAEALQVSFPVRRALVAASERDSGTAEFVSVLSAAGTPIEYVDRSVLNALSSHGAHQGIMLEVGSFPYADLSEIIADSGTDPALVLVLDHVTDEGNLGAIIRSAEVVGASGVVIASKRAAGVGIGTFKTSAGAALHLPIARVTNIARALDQLKEAGFWVVGASEHAQGDCWSASLEGRIALVMGSEGSGLSRLIQERCDHLVRLPQRGITESLNVAQAATVLSYEWLRQNRDALPEGNSTTA